MLLMSLLFLCEVVVVVVVDGGVVAAVDVDVFDAVGVRCF